MNLKVAENKYGKLGLYQLLKAFEASYYTKDDSKVEPLVDLCYASKPILSYSSTSLLSCFFTCSFLESAFAFVGDFVLPEAAKWLGTDK
jgi:hypothetical protein